MPAGRLRTALDVAVVLLWALTLALAWHVVTTAADLARDYHLRLTIEPAPQGRTITPRWT